MLKLRRFAAFLLAAVLTVGASIAADRFGHGNLAALEAAAERLKQVPADFGDWKRVADEEIDPQTMAMLECKGSLNRVFRHQGTGHEIKMFVIVGPPGPTSVHSPEVCYSGAGFQSREEPQRLLLGSAPVSAPEFWKASLESGGPTPQQLAVVFGWNSGSGWVAANYPRLAFAGKPFLYKLQIATSAKDDADQASAVCEQFLEESVPVLDEVLFGTPAN